MPRLPKGQIYTRHSGGDLVYMLRFRANGYPRSPIELGRRSQGFNMEKANGEAAVIAALIRRGEWQPARPERRPAAGAAPTTFAAACAKLLADKEDEEISGATLADYRSKIEVHLLPGIGPSTPITAIDDQMLDEYVGGIRAHNDAIREANRLAKDDPAVHVPRRPPTTREIERWGGKLRATQKLKPISNGEIIRHLELLSQILRYYVIKTKELDEDPVGVWDRRPKRKRDHARKPDWMLEPDEIVSLLAASAVLDDRIENEKTRRLRQACLRLRGQGRTHAQIAAELGVPESTAYYHASKFGKVDPTVRVRMYEALIWVLFIAGLRISEALALRCEDIHMLHRNIYVQDSKTESGRRVVHIHPPAHPVLNAYIQARGDTWREGEYAFRTSKGTPLSRHNVARRTMPRLVRAANDLRHRKGCPPITARVTAHGMRHAYVALIAHSSAPQIYAQKQAGHQRASTTEEIYNYVFREDTRDRVGREMVKVLARAQRTLHANGKTPRRRRRGQGPARAVRRAR